MNHTKRLLFLHITNNLKQYLVNDIINIIYDYYCKIQIKYEFIILDNIESNKYTFNYSYQDWYSPPPTEFTRWIGEYTIGQVNNKGQTILWFKPNIADAFWGEVDTESDIEHYYQLLEKGKPGNYNNLRGSSLTNIINQVCNNSNNNKWCYCFHRNIYQFNDHILHFCSLKLRKKIKDYDLNKCVFLESYSNGNFGPCLWIIRNFDKVIEELNSVLKDFEHIQDFL
jgi:hypothetical protein